MIFLKRIFLRALIELRDNPETRIKEYGICGNVGRVFSYKGNFVEVLNSLISKWPDASKYSALYPVEGSGAIYFEDSKSSKLWENPRRLALLDFMIKTLETEIEAESQPLEPNDHYHLGA